MSKPAFLEILQKTRTEVYTTDCVVGAWRKVRCWLINRDLVPPPPTLTLPPRSVSDRIRAPDTPALPELS